eukprot:s3328_g7.t1
MIARSVTSVGLEFLLMALRRAQAYLKAMAQHQPNRAYQAAAFELQCIRAAGRDVALLDWHLNDVAPKKLEARAKDWLVGLSEPQRPGLCFLDAYIGTADGRLKQCKNHPRHGCYMGVPCSLIVRPGDSSTARFVQILLSSFAGGDGLRVLLDQCALVVVRQSDVLHVVGGQGHDGKIQMFADHVRVVFGSGFGCCPCSALQTDREFPQQGLNFIHCAYMVFDGSKREYGRGPSQDFRRWRSNAFAQDS